MTQRFIIKENTELTKRHFACRVYHSYFHYLKTKFPQVDLPALCLEAGLPLSYLLDESNWVSVCFDQKFTAKCIEATGQKDLCYRVGEQSVSPEVMGKVVHFFLKHTLSMKHIYAALPKLTSVFSKVTEVVIVKKGVNFIELRLRPLDQGLNKEEREALLTNLPNIFQNTIGHFAAAPTIHGLPPAKISYSEVPSPDNEYQIQIKYPMKLSLSLPYFSFIAISICLAAFLLNEGYQGVSFDKVLALLCLAISYILFSVVRYRKLQTGLAETIGALQELDQRYHSLQEARESAQQLSKSYSRFVPWELLRILNKESIIDLQFGDHVEKEMTIFFADIRDFTSLVESWPPKDTFNFLNSLLARISPIVRKNGGFIDKYMGDGIMAIFPYRADSAIIAAIEINKSLDEYNLERTGYGRSPIKCGIGINTGKSILGTIGSAEYMEGTVVSDCVNTASRLEGLTKIFGTSIVIGEETLTRGGHFAGLKYRPLGPIPVKGRLKYVRPYEVLNTLPVEEQAKKEKTKMEFIKALTYFEGNDFVNASEHFRRVLAMNPADKAAEFYLQRMNNGQIKVIPDAA